MASVMPLEIARHEVAHLLGTAVAYLGDESPRMKFFSQHPRYYDAQVYIGFDAAAQQGEFSAVISKFSVNDDQAMPDRAIDAIRRSSAIAPIALAFDGNRVLKSLSSAMHWLDLLRDFNDILSPEDRQLAIKGNLAIRSHEELVGAFAWPAAMQICPQRVDGIVGLVAKHGGIGGTLPLRNFVPRDLANKILDAALKQAKTCFALAHA